MCQIQIIKRLDGKNLRKEDLYEFYKLMCFGSFNNADAFGVFNRNYSFKVGGRFNSAFLDEKALLRDNILVGHNRLATSSWRYIPQLPSPKMSKKKFIKSVRPTWFDGVISSLFGEIKPSSEDKMQKNAEPEYNSNSNNHPFVLGDLTLVHNGIIYNDLALRKKEKMKFNIVTDSYTVLALIDKYITLSSNKIREKAIVTSIQKVASLLSGTYSIVLHDRQQNQTYYFKNDSTEFYFYLIDKSILIGSTDYQNLDMSYFNARRRQEIIIKSGFIYRIGENPSRPLVNVGAFCDNSYEFFKNPQKKRFDSNKNVYHYQMKGGYEYT